MQIETGTYFDWAYENFSEISEKKFLAEDAEIYTNISLRALRSMRETNWHRRDEVYDGPFCNLSVVDHRTFKRLTYRVLELAVQKTVHRVRTMFREMHSPPRSPTILSLHNERLISLHPLLCYGLKKSWYHENLNKTVFQTSNDPLVNPVLTLTLHSGFDYGSPCLSIHSGCSGSSLICSTSSGVSSRYLMSRMWPSVFQVEIPNGR